MCANRIWKQPERASKFVEKLMQRWKGSAEQNNHLLAGVWKSIVGEQIATHTKPGQIQNRKWTIRVESSAWMNELTFLKEKIKIEAKIKLSEHGIPVDDVIFRLG